MSTSSPVIPGPVLITHDDTPIIIDDTSSMNVRCRGLVRAGHKLKSTMEVNSLAIYRVQGPNVTGALGAFAPIQRVTLRIKGPGLPKEMVLTVSPLFDMDTSAELPNFDPPGKFDNLGRAIETLQHLGGGPCRIVGVTVRVNGADTTLDTSGPGKTVLVFTHVHG